MDNEEQSSMEFFIYFLIFIAVIGLLTAIYLYGHKATAYNSPKPEVVEKVLDAPVKIPASINVETPKKQTIVHPCDPKELGCGVTYYHDGVASKVE